MKTYVGIDVSKLSLSLAIPSLNAGWQVTSLANSPEGIRSLITLLPPGAHCVLEATGSYWVLLTYLLSQAQITRSVISPKQRHYFAKMQLSITKTDPREAVLLAEYGPMMQPAVYQISSDRLLLLSQKRALLKQYQKQRTALLNWQESFSSLPVKDAATQQSLQDTITHFEHAIQQLPEEIYQVCRLDFDEQYRRLTSIKGISQAVATALIETTNGFQDFHSAKALAKFIGLVPITYQSGKTGFSQAMSRAGDAHLRSLL